MGGIFPEPPGRRTDDARAEKLDVSWIGDSLGPVHPGAKCGMSDVPRDRVVRVVGNIVSGHLFARDGAPVAFLMLGYMSAGMIAPADRRDDAELRRLLAEGLQGAVE